MGFDPQSLSHALSPRYELGEVLGEGATATVYAANDRRHGRRVALKVLKLDVAATIGAARFSREIELVAQLHHPHILPLYDSGEAAGYLYFTMPLADGDTLEQRLRQLGRLPVVEATRIAREVADALAFAHERGIIHRDIKPSNILLTAGHAIVADFGIARLTDSVSSQLTRPGLAIGTPTYMSPEQAGGESDARSDIYSLGCVLHEMLTGNPPYAGATLGQLLAMHATGPVPAIRVARPDVPMEVEAAIARALQKSPDDRYEDARQFAAALAVAEPREAATEGPKPTSRGRRASAILFALVAVTVISLLAWKGRQTRSARESLTDVAELAAGGRYLEAWEHATRAARHVPESALTDLWPSFARWTRATSTPAGATVWWSPLDSIDDWRLLGITPTDSSRVPFGAVRWKVTMPEHDSLLDTGNIDFSRAGNIRIAHFTLQPAGSTPTDMVQIPADVLRFGLFGFDYSEVFPASGYYMGRHEVTNREYRAFVEAGGYANREYWTEAFLAGESELSFEEAMSRFRDRSGRPGPATWDGGVHPNGADDEPVGGISWYEAAAFANFAGKRLPTVYHWTSATDRWMAASILPLSNIGHAHDRSLPVGSTPFGPWGTYDMPGNVREWVWNATGSTRFLLGGSWNDEPYMFYEPDARSPFDRSPENGFRLALYPPDNDSLLDILERPIALRTFDLTRIVPASDDVFAAYRAQYAYDPAPLHADIFAIDDTPEHWRVESVSFDAAYPNDRVTVHVYVPRGLTPPLQAVVYWPSSAAILGESSQRPGSIAEFEYVVKSGRIVAYPTYKGTYERNNGLRTWVPDESRFYTETVIDAVKDLRRTIDYLVSRPDVDASRIAFLGTSWGGFIGTIPLAVESRLATGILIGGGFPSVPARPEVSEYNFAPRVRAPVLMINGRHDFLFPYEASQVPMFDSFGSEPTAKKHALYDAHHDVFGQFPGAIRAGVLDWLESNLGRVR